jgi:uncharacterized protein (TIGR02594 family)
VRPAELPLWVLVALGEMGVLEDLKPGKSNPRIEQYHAITRGGPALDDVAWCASFVSWCLEMAGVESLKTKRAADYATFGSPTEPGRFGALLVFGKADPDAKGSGHVGWSLGRTGGSVYCLGGNQSNKVGIDLRPLSLLVSARLPLARPVVARAQQRT